MRPGFRTGTYTFRAFVLEVSERREWNFGRKATGPPFIATRFVRVTKRGQKFRDNRRKCFSWNELASSYFPPDSRAKRTLRNEVVYVLETNGNELQAMLFEI